MTIYNMRLTMGRTPTKNWGINHVQTHPSGLTITNPIISLAWRVNGITKMGIERTWKEHHDPKVFD
jgi:hypothetical protein